MQTIRIMLDYKCHPVWIYNEEGDIIANALPKELEDDKYVCALCDNIKKQYESLFIDTKTEFSYIGDQHPDIEKILEEKLKTLTAVLKIKLGKNYNIQLK